MHRLTKGYPPDKTVLDDISLSFLPGAKIGVLGLNGAGKSTLLRIMAGRDNEFRGDASSRPARTVGLLEQEPQLDEAKDVRGQRRGGRRRDSARCWTASTSSSANYSDETADEFARLQDQIDAADAWNLDTQLEYRDGRAAPAARRRRRLDALRRRAPPRRAVPPAAARARPAAARRADQPPRRRVVAWLERHLAEYQGTVVAVTHDRYFLDNVAGWILELDRGRGIPFKGNYSSGSSRSRSAWRTRRRPGQARASARSRRARVGAH